MYYFADTGNVTIAHKCDGANVNGINGVNSVEALSYFPNPAADILTVQNVPATCETFVLYDMAGSMVLMTPSLHRSVLHMNISSLPAGVYTAVAMGDNYREINKVVVAR